MGGLAGKATCGGKTVGWLCQVSGMSGYKTNHSLRETTAILFQAGVEEQLIMSRTSHQSLDGVRMYKRVPEEQVSSVLNSATNCMEESPHENKKIKLVDGQDHEEQASQPLTLSICTNVTINFHK